MIRPPSPWAVIIMGIVGQGIALVLIIGYINRVDRAAERRNVERQQQICGIVTLIDDRNQAMPPSPDRDTMTFRAEMHTYRLSLGCP